MFSVRIGRRHGHAIEERRKFKEYSELIGAPEIRALKRQLQKTNDNVKRDAIELEIAGYQSEIDGEEKYLRKAQATLQAFRATRAIGSTCKSSGSVLPRPPLLSCAIIFLQATR